MNEDNCFFCSDKIQPEERNSMYREETTWVSDKGIVTKPTGRVAHKSCVTADAKEIPGQLKILP